jgi:hypothetical protein
MPRGDRRSAQAFKSRVDAQQAVLNQLRSGQGITGAQPANPIIGGIQSVFGGAGEGTIPTLYGAKLGGEEVLLGKGAWNTKTAGSGPINVGGRTWYPAQRGEDLVYKAGSEAGKYGSILPSASSTSPDRATAPAAPPVTADPLSRLSPEDRAYQQERARVEAMVKSNPDMQKQEIAEARAKVRDEGMAIWAAKHKGLAKQVMPGQSGFSAIQGVVGRMPAPSDNPLMARTFGYQTGGAPDQQMGAATTGPTPAVLQADPVLNAASPKFIGGEIAPPINFGSEDVTPEMIEKYAEELLKRASSN